MALINCPECNKDVSETALACPHCGFGVAKYTEELKRERETWEKEQETKRLLEMKQTERNAKKEKQAVIKQMKSNYLKQNHKKSLWIFAVQMLCSVIIVLLPYVWEYIARKQAGHSSVNGDTIFSWMYRNVWYLLPFQTGFYFIILLAPAILYVVANNIKKIKVAKILLLVGLLYMIALFAFVSIFNVIGITYTIGWVIPLCGYLVIYWNATHFKRNSL